MLDSQSNRTDAPDSTKREERVFMDTMRNFWHNVLTGFKKFFIWMLIFSIIVPTAVYFYNERSYTPRYESSVTFLAKPLISNTSTKMSDIFYYNNNVIMGSQLSVTFPYIFESGILKEIVQSEIGTAIDAKITARSVANTNYFKITVNSDTPENAKKVADSLMKNFSKVSEIVLGEIRTEIKIPSQLPTAPCNTNDKWFSTLYAFATVIVLCIFFLCIYAMCRKTVCSKEDIKYDLNQPYICEIPLAKEKRKSENKFISIIKSKSFNEALRTMKSRILGQMMDNRYKTIGVVSTTNNEGKTTVAAGLARVLADKTEPTILVTFDSAIASHTKRALKRKRTTAVYCLEEYATEMMSAPVSGTKKLFKNVDLLVLPVSVISDKQHTAEIFKTLAENYAYVIIDIVPGYSHSESVAFIDFCDAYIPVIRCDYVPINKIKNTLQYFSFSRARNLGVVLNGVSSTYISYGRYSNYGKYRKYAYGYNYYSYGRYEEDPKN